MLSKNALVKARNAMESMYDGSCTVTEYREYKKENKSTGYQEVIVLENQKCRLSYSTVTGTNTSNGMPAITQGVKLFLSPDISIKPGSKITVSQAGRTTEYKSSGVPALYETHQEIALEMFERWA